jgi:hypothetical protein
MNTLRFCIKFFVYSILLFTICGCQKHQEKKEKYSKLKKQVTDLKNKEIVIPDSLMIYKKKPDTLQFINLSKNLNFFDTYKIVTYINGDCGSCVMQINSWQRVLNMLKYNNKAKFIPIIYTTDINLFKRKMAPKIKISHPFYFDFKDEYITINKLYKYNEQFYTFLLNDNNQVILVGNPVYSPKLMKLYKEEINKRLDKQ